MPKITFYRGNSINLPPISERDENGVYFILDTQEIHIGEDVFHGTDEIETIDGGELGL